MHSKTFAASVFLSSVIIFALSSLGKVILHFKASRNAAARLLDVIVRVILVNTFGLNFLSCRLLREVFGAFAKQSIYSHAKSS